MNNIQGTIYESYVSDTLFCNDRQLRSQVGGTPSGTGFGSDLTYYAAYYRVKQIESLNIKCGEKNDRFTVTDTVKGNGALTYPIGLITPDELIMSGLKFFYPNTTNYFLTQWSWWTMGPTTLNESTTYVGLVTPNSSIISSYVTMNDGVRGVLNLKSGTQAIGIGTTTDPFKVV